MYIYYDDQIPCTHVAGDEQETIVIDQLETMSIRCHIQSKIYPRCMITVFYEKNTNVSKNDKCRVIFRHF